MFYADERQGLKTGKWIGEEAEEAKGKSFSDEWMIYGVQFYKSSKQCGLNCRRFQEVELEQEYRRKEDTYKKVYCVVEEQGKEAGLQCWGVMGTEGEG